MSAEEYRYNAFISYRHLTRDIKLVRVMQKLLEAFRAPCDGEYIRKGERIERLFTDRSELPMSADLGASIRNALSDSRFLVVMACPEYMESKWCMEELRTFLAINGRSTDRILFVRTGGTPECVTEILSASGVATNADGFSEPLYIDVCADRLRESVKLVRKEYLRLAAMLIGCSYDQLYQRHLRWRRRRRLTIAAVALALLAVVGLALKAANDQRVRAEIYREMDSAVNSVYTLLDTGDAAEALQVMDEIYDRYGQEAEYGEYLAGQLETAIPRASCIPAYSPFAVEPLPAESASMALTSDGKHLIAYDIDALRDDAVLKIFLYDAYLRRVSEHALPMGDWNREILLDAISGWIRIDYDAAQQVFTVERRSDDSKTSGDILGERRTFSADGTLLDVQSLTADEHGRTTASVRKLYEELVLADWRPGCMSADGIYTVITDEGGGFNPYGDAGDRYQVIFIPEAGDVYYVIAEIERYSGMHEISDMYISPDDSYVIVKERQGVYNDVLVVCDAKGRYAPVTVDTGSCTVQELLCRVDPETSELLLLLNLYKSGISSDGSLIGCSIAGGKALNCERYDGKNLSNMLFSEQGYVYLISDYAQIMAVTTGNISLPELLTGTEREVPVRLEFRENDLIEDVAAFDPGSSSHMDSVAVGSMTVTPECIRTNFRTPTNYTGVDPGVALLDREGNALVQFYTEQGNAYYNAEDGVFGLINYDAPDSSQLFRLYGLQELMRLFGE